MPIGVATILTTLTLAGSLHGAYSHVWPKRRGAKQGSAEVGHRRPPGCIKTLPMNAANQGRTIRR